jgi:ankyrin repeat protein
VFSYILSSKAFSAAWSPNIFADFLIAQWSWPKALEGAIRQRRLDLVKAILAKNTDGGLVDLHLAVEEGHLGILKECLACCSAETTLDKDGETPLECAIKMDRVDLVEALLDAGADGQLHKATSKEMVEAIASKRPVWVNEADGGGDYPLNIVARRGNLAIVKALLEAGADVNCPGCFGNTPLHAASTMRHAQVVRELLLAGADCLATNDGGLTPMACVEIMLTRFDMTDVIEALKGS